MEKSEENEKNGKKWKKMEKKWKKKKNERKWKKMKQQQQQQSPTSNPIFRENPIHNLQNNIRRQEHQIPVAVCAARVAIGSVAISERGQISQRQKCQESTVR